MFLKTVFGEYLYWEELIHSTNILEFLQYIRCRDSVINIICEWNTLLKIGKAWERIKIKYLLTHLWHLSILMPSLSPNIYKSTYKTSWKNEIKIAFLCTYPFFLYFIYIWSVHTWHRKASTLMFYLTCGNRKKNYFIEIESGTLVIKS